MYNKRLKLPNFGGHHLDKRLAAKFQNMIMGLESIIYSSYFIRLFAAFHFSQQKVPDV